MDLKSYPKVGEVILGVEGQKRPLDCTKPECDGPVSKASTLLSVVSLTTGPDGSVYVGDFNVVRKLTVDGKVSTILQFG